MARLPQNAVEATASFQSARRISNSTRPPAATMRLNSM